MDLSKFKPTLAGKYEPSKIVFPVYGSPKLDGIRASVLNGRLLARSLKPIPNKGVYGLLSHPVLDGMDGELVVGEPTAKDVYTTTTSHIMSHDKVFRFTYFVFDHFSNPAAPFSARLAHLAAEVGRIQRSGAFQNGVNIVLLPQTLLENEPELLAYEQEQVALGYEGVCLRSPASPYKFGRSTTNEGYLLKLKRFMDSEAEIIGFEEQMHNGNEATTNELGRTKRSSHKANKVGKDTLGALVARDCVTGIEFNIGTGMDDVTRQSFWDNQQQLLGKLVKYKYFPVGVKDAPRHPVFLGLRDAGDM